MAESLSPDSGQPRVLVLLPIHGSGIYLDQFLDSLAAQKGVTVTLLVLLDGATPDVIRQLAQHSKRMDVSVIPEPTSTGLPDVFLELISQAPLDFDLYCFADGDDVWHPNKLATAYADLVGVRDLPSLWVCGWVEFGSRLSDVAPRKPSCERDALAVALVDSVAPGCCMVWNQALQQSVKFPPASAIVMHDSWMMLWAVMYGRLVVQEMPLVFYRLHEANSVGVSSSLVARLRRFDPEQYRLRVRQAREILNFKDSMAASDAVVLRSFAFGGRVNRLASWSLFRFRRRRLTDQVVLAAYDLCVPRVPVSDDSP